MEDGPDGQAVTSRFLAMKESLSNTILENASKRKKSSFGGFSRCVNVSGSLIKATSRI